MVVFVEALLQKTPMRHALILLAVVGAWSGCRRDVSNQTLDASMPAVDAGPRSESPLPQLADEPLPVRRPAAQPAPVVVLEPERRDAGAPALRAFFISTDPPDASIFVDHIERGRSPLTVDAPASTVWGLLAEMPGYAPAELRVWPEPVPPKTISLTLEALPPPPVDAGVPLASLELDSFPYGYVVLDGQDAGLTPQTVTVTAGTHEVVVMHAMCVMWRESVAVAAGETKQVFARLICGPR